MNTVDYILVVLMAISGLVGVLRGFIREALSVLVWILALWGAARYGGQLGPLLSGVLEEPALQLWAGRTLAFVGILFAGSLLGWLVGYLEQDGNVYFYATNVEAPDPAPDGFASARREITEAILKSIGLM